MLGSVSSEIGSFSAYRLPFEQMDPTCIFLPVVAGHVGHGVAEHAESDFS